MRTVVRSASDLSGEDREEERTENRKPCTGKENRKRGNLDDDDGGGGVAVGVVRRLAGLAKMGSRGEGSVREERKGGTAEEQEKEGRTEKTATHLPSLDVLHDFLLPRQRGLLPPVDVAIRLGEKKGDEVDPRPSALALQFPVSTFPCQ